MEQGKNKCTLNMPISLRFVKKTSTTRNILNISKQGPQAAVSKLRHVDFKLLYIDLQTL